MTVSLTMIVKNEERTLGRCLESVRGVFDEIIVVDTGSTDRTKAIAASFGATVLDFTWCDDFSAARQFAFDQATGDWVAWLDADDVLEGGEHLRTHIERAPADVAAFHWRYVTSWDNNGKPTLSYWRERCVRNNGTFRWAGVVHEVLVSEWRVPIQRIDDVFVRHYPEHGKPGKSTRNVEILSRQYDANDGKLEPRMLFYLGRELSDTGQTARAIDILEQHDTVGQWDDERYHAKLLLGGLYAARGEYDRAAEVYFGAVKLFPLWPNAYFGLAAMAYFKQAWRLVVHWVDIGRSLPPPDTVLFVNQRSLDYDWVIHYTNALYHLSRVREALAWTEHALTIVPNDAMHLSNRSYFTTLVDAMAAEDPNGICPPAAEAVVLAGASV